MEFILMFFCFCSEVSLLFSTFSAFYFSVFSFSTLCPFLLFPQTRNPHALPPLLVRLFSIQAYDTPLQGPSLGRPILGASNHGYLLCLLITWIFGCWCEENTGRHFKGFYFIKYFSMQNNKYMGEIECK